MSTIATLRDISVVIIFIQVFVVLLVPGVILFFANKGLSWLRRQVRKYGDIAVTYSRRAVVVTDQVSTKVAEPVIAVDTFAARVRRLRSAIQGK